MIPLRIEKRKQERKKKIMTTCCYKRRLFFFFLREREPAGEGQRIQSAVSTEPHAGLKFTNGEITAWAEVGCLTDWATQVPHKKRLNQSFIVDLSYCLGLSEGTILPIVDNLFGCETFIEL